MSDATRIVRVSAPASEAEHALLAAQIDWIARQPYAPSADALGRTVAALARDAHPVGTGPCGWLALDQRGDVVGMLLGALQFDTCDLEYLAVREGWRGCGIGAALLARFHADLHANGVERALLEVAVGNAPAVALYVRSGYAQIHRRPRYYRNGDDAIVMEARL